jgi:hypothetical protein
MSGLNAVHLVVHEEAFEKRMQIKSNEINVRVANSVKMAVKRETETKGWNERNSVTDALIANLDRQIEEAISLHEKKVEEWDLFNPSRQKRPENQAANQVNPSLLFWVILAQTLSLFD